MRMVKLNKTVSERTFGIEIEFNAAVNMRIVAITLQNHGIECVAESYNHTTRSSWKLVPDSSVHSNFRRYNMELVSPVLKGAEGLAEIRKVCKVLNNSAIDAKVNHTCGLHVHHGANDFGESQMRNLVSLYKNYEGEMDKMVARSRRGNANHYCSSLQNKEIANVRASRYHKLNLAAFTRHGTVEIRHMNGTTNADKICGWIVLTQAVVERAAEAKSIRKC